MNETIQNNTLIELNKISATYHDVLALYNINLSVKKGEYVGISGPNASGKTTLLKIILGIKKPDTGQINIFGKNINKNGMPKKFRHKIAYVPQNKSIGKNFPALVRDVVMMGRYSQIGIFRPITKRDKKVVEESLRKMGMLEFAKRPIGHLSGGQQQKVLIARALAQEPEILLLDEPTSALDFKVVKELGKIIKNLHEETNLTILEINHNLEILREVCDKIIILNKTIIWEGSADSPEFYEVIEKVFYLSHPRKPPP
ncbi:MAG: ATP-binding cassette domain-containing protein [Candidatus Lokiarchaeota archaeon]|nr:ATP-binding cassette domain-containing protein [Candidatus Lokiarchaeota archaeon]